MATVPPPPAELDLETFVADCLDFCADQNERFFNYMTTRGYELDDIRAAAWELCERAGRGAMF